MRLAVLADVHGNLQALEAVLEHARRQSVDEIIIAGDLVNGLPDSKMCWDLVQFLALPMLRGNHERSIFHYDTPFANPKWYKENFKGLGWLVKQFSEVEKQKMAQLPLHLHFEDLLIVHASFRDDYDSITPETSEDSLKPMFEGSDETFIIRGHNHVSFSTRFGRRSIESLGSVGLPLDGTPEAKYIIAEKHEAGWTFSRQQVPYDRASVVQRLGETDYFEQHGPVGKLFLQELLTSREQLFPFLSNYKKWSQHDALTMDQAVDAYLLATS